jgi:hypothetical protein
MQDREKISFQDFQFNATSSYISTTTGKDRTCRKEADGVSYVEDEALVAGELKARPPQKWTHHSSTSTAAEAARAHAAFVGGGMAIPSYDGDGSEPGEVSTPLPFSEKILCIADADTVFAARFNIEFTF